MQSRAGAVGSGGSAPGLAQLVRGAAKQTEGRREGRANPPGLVQVVADYACMSGMLDLRKQLK